MKYIRVTILLIVLQALPLSAQQFKLKSKPDLDGWSLAHAGGGAVLYGAWRLYGLEPAECLIPTIIMGVMWEIYIDGFQNDLLGIKVDPEGADLIGDTFCVALGAGLAYLIDMQILKSKGRVYVRGKRAYLVIPL